LKRILSILATLITFSGLYAQDTVKLCPSPDSMRYYVNGPDGMIYHWSVKGGNYTAYTDTLNDTVYINWLQTAGIYSLSVYGDLYGCLTETKNLSVKIKENPPVSLGPDVDLCEGEQVTLTVPDSFNNVKWKGNTTGRDKSVTTTDTVWVSAYNANNCISYDTVMVNFYPVPLVKLGNDTDLCGTAHKTLDAGNPGAIYQWHEDDIILSSVTQKIDIGIGIKKIWVVVTDTSTRARCEATDTINIMACKTVFDPKNVPNVFTPGTNDDINNNWQINGLSDYPKAIVEVYDMWGRLVYRSQPGYPENWNGKSGSKYAPMGTYYYIIYLHNKKKDVHTGSITIIR
jgi:gliding motility-associated-like protein